MGLIYAMLTLENAKRPDIQPIEVEALAGSGSLFLVVTEHIRVQLQLDDYGTKEVTLADGSRRLLPYVGPVATRFKNRVAIGGAIVMGDEVLLGAIPMEDMDLILMPMLRKVDINPANPNFA